MHDVLTIFDLSYLLTASGNLFFLIFEIIILCFVVICDPVCTLWRLCMALFKCYQHLEIFSEIRVMPVKLQFAVSWASLIFQKRFPDTVST